jgi:hypothetical protein
MFEKVFRTGSGPSPHTSHIRWPSSVLVKADGGEPAKIAEGGIAQMMR